MNTTILCVLRSGGQYDSEWVRKLRDGIHRNTTAPYDFKCLSDVDLKIDEVWKPKCERIPLEHEWPGWWAKIEMFRPGVITGPTLYLDLDTIITGNVDHLIDDLRHSKYQFAMLRNFHQSDFVGSGVMWFSGENAVPHKIYEKFKKMPECYIAHHDRVRKGSHLGDQAFIWDTLGGEIDKLDVKGLKSFKYHARTFLPPDAALVCFHGQPRPQEAKAAWVAEHWR
jgi:hypothetical protein